MSWRTLTIADLETRLSAEEIQSYASTSTDSDPVAALIEQTADEVRGYVAANGSAVLADAAHSVPPMLVGATLDLVVVNLLKCVNLPVNETRKSAADAARALLEKIAEGRITPERGNDTATAPGAPDISVKPPIL